MIWETFWVFYDNFRGASADLFTSDLILRKVSTWELQTSPCHLLAIRIGRRGLCHMIDKQIYTTNFKVIDSVCILVPSQ